MRIDPHEHCRDGKQAHKTTIAKVLKLAEEQGVGIIFDMPNTDPPLVTGAAVAERMKLVPRERRDYYFVWLGMTSDSAQVELAARSYRENGKIVGFKLYAGKSVGSLAVIDPSDQFRIYQLLAQFGYEGVLAVHCEREDMLKPDLWDPANPISHSMARPKEAEIQAVDDQIRFSRDVDFKGILHIAHVSCPESVSLIKQARARGMSVTCEVTPHHLMYADEVQQGPDGLRYKVNPPLRSLADVHDLRYCLLRREINWIATDHAPHTDEEKMSSPYLSGFPSLHIYRECVEDFLPEVGARKNLIEEITLKNIVKVFGDRIGGSL